MLQSKAVPSRLEAYASPLMVVGAAAILAVVVVVLSYYNVNREARFTSSMLSEKGAVLVRAFEAGARAGMMGPLAGEQRIQMLAEQFALLPGVLSITLVDLEGRVLVSSDAQRIGQTYLEPKLFSSLESGNLLQWRILETATGGREFVVYKFFTPLHPPREHQGHDPARMGRRGAERGPRPEQDAPPPHPEGGPRGAMQDRLQRNWQQFCTMMGMPPEPDAPARAILFIGLDLAPFEEARAQDVRTSLLLGATLLALGLGGVVALYWAQRLRVSRRLLQETRAFADEVITRMPMGLVAVDPEGRVSLFNGTAAALLRGGCTLEEGRSAEECLPGELAATLRRLLQEPEATAEDAPTEQVLECDVGGEAPLPLSVSGVRIRSMEGRVVGAVLLLSDLRELRRLQAAVHRAQRLAAIGSLAAGVAHEIRNPLSSIKASATFFGSRFEEGSDGKRMAEIMVQEVERLNRAVTQLLEYARPSQLAARETPLVPLVQRCLELVRRDAEARGVTVELEAREAPAELLLDPDRLTQALLNLFVNAVQAMDRGGRLSVKVGREPAPAGGAERVRIDVQDTGPGLAAEDQARIFDPYYTTKPRGTGLGLAIVQKIVEAHRGEVRVHSTPGQGAVFSILLPLSGARQSEEAV